MRSMLLTALAAATLAGGAAAAQPVATVSVSISPELQAKARLYGQRELDMLAVDLQQDVQRALERSGQAGPNGAQLRLVLVDARPNRPTFKQLGDTPGLSLESFGIGGAEISGVLTNPDGSSRNLHYRWYESDIRQSAYQSTWGDAEWTFNQFAGDLAHGRYTER
jgi:hypothetical protein